MPCKEHQIHSPITQPGHFQLCDLGQETSLLSAPVSVLSSRDEGDNLRALREVMDAQWMATQYILDK